METQNPIFNIATQCMTHSETSMLIENEWSIFEYERQEICVIYLIHIYVAAKQKRKGINTLEKQQNIEGRRRRNQRRTNDEDKEQSKPLHKRKTNTKEETAHSKQGKKTERN